MASADSDSDEELNKRFQEGKQFFADHKYGEARTRFLEACAVLKTANCPKNLALCEEQLSMWPDATAHLREWIDDPRTKDDHFRADMERKYLDLRSKVGELDFLSTKEGARVRVDGTLIGTTPIMHAVFVPVGAHVIEAQWPLSLKKADVNVDAGKSLRIELSPDNVTATASAPVTPGMMPKGSEPQTVTSRVAFPPPTGALVLGALGFVGLGFGVGFGLDASGKNDDLRSNPTSFSCQRTPASADCLAGEDRRASAATSQTIATVSFVVGGAALASALAWWIIAPRTRTVVIPAASTNSFGLNVVTSF